MYDTRHLSDTRLSDTRLSDKRLSDTRLSDTRLSEWTNPLQSLRGWQTKITSITNYNVSLLMVISVNAFNIVLLQSNHHCRSGHVVCRAHNLCYTCEEKKLWFI